MKNKKIYYLIGTVLIVISIFLFLSACDIAKMIKIDDLKEIENSKETAIIYIYNSDSNICINCNELRKYLTKKKIKYRTFDLKNEEDKGKEFFKALHINTKTFNIPALIYIQDGTMTSYLMNIKDKTRLDKFIEEYKLKKVE